MNDPGPNLFRETSRSVYTKWNERLANSVRATPNPSPSSPRRFSREQLCECECSPDMSEEKFTDERKGLCGGPNPDDGRGLESDIASVQEAARVLHSASYVLISTGAGMSAESGVPTYRDKHGVWRDFELYSERGLNPAEIAHIDGFERDPHLAWGFQETMRALMHRAEPHAGYEVVRAWLQQRFRDRSFLLTSNIDGLHVRSGVDKHRMWERYGCIWNLSCLARCTDEIWREERVPLFEVDPQTLRSADIPKCPVCGGPARPATQLDHDPGLIKDPIGAARYQSFLDRKPDVYVVIGTTLWFSWPESVQERPTVIHINPSEETHQRYDDALAITMGAKDALIGMEWMLSRLDKSESS